jgi:hypothetical protein
MLLAIVNGPGPLNQRIDALSAMRDVANPPKDKLEAATLRILRDPGMNTSTRKAAIHAVASHNTPDSVIDVLAESLADPDWQIRMQVVLAMRGFGPRAIGKYHGALAKLANDKDQPEPVRVMAQNTLDGKEEKCVQVQTNPPALVPIPNCKAN